MGKVLYEVHFQFELFMIIPVLMLAFIVFFPKIQKKWFIQAEKELTQTSKQFTRIFCIAAGVFVTLIIIILIISETVMYFKTVGAYNRGEYQIVEGYVENFNPMPYTGHSDESFEINGVHFAYSDYGIQQGYHNAKSHGGVISGDGQYLKIGYINLYSNSEYRNIIVYIEELLPPS